MPDPVPEVMTSELVRSCDRWHPSRAEREACDHGLPIPTVPHESAPAAVCAPDPGVRVNRFAGSCLWCGGTVAIRAGLLVEHHGALLPVHRDGDCA